MTGVAVEACAVAAVSLALHGPAARTPPAGESA
jgi:hypothetical protein